MSARRGSIQQDTAITGDAAETEAFAAEALLLTRHRASRTREGLTVTDSRIRYQRLYNDPVMWSVCLPQCHR